MWILPGSFRTEYGHSRDEDSSHHIRCYPPEEEAVTIELPAGGALHVLNDGIAGRSGDGFRPETMPLLSGPEASGGVKEHGVQVAGTWEAQTVRLTGSA